MACEKVATFLKSHLYRQKKNITVSVFASTLQLTALLLKSFRLRLHCYIILFCPAVIGALAVWIQNQKNKDSLPEPGLMKEQKFNGGCVP